MQKKVIYNYLLKCGYYLPDLKDKSLTMKKLKELRDGVTTCPYKENLVVLPFRMGCNISYLIKKFDYIQKYLNISLWFMQGRKPSKKYLF